MLFDDLIIFEDEKLIFINKPAGVSSLDERNEAMPSIKKLAKKYNSQLQLCHRIDKDTSGVLVLSKQNEVYKQVSYLFEHREVKKIYHAVVWGSLNVNNVSINLPLVQAKNATAKVDFKMGKQSQTIINTIKVYKHFTLVECIPKTGRFHQIRIHLSSQNHPLVADELYHGKKLYLSNLKKNFHQSKYSEEEPIIKRFALHAYQISFKLNDTVYSQIAPYPKDFSVLLKLLDKHNSLV